MTTHIKTANINDLYTLCELHCEGWKSAYMEIGDKEFLEKMTPEDWIEKFKRWFANNDVLFKIIYVDNEAAGTVAYGHSREPENKADYCEIRSIYFKPQYTGLGLGSLLLESAIADLKKLGYKKCYLWVFDGNKKAREFYHKHGFHFQGEDGYYTMGSKEMYEYCYVKDL